MIQIDEQKLRQLFKNRSNCYADAEDVIQAMDEDFFIETVNEALRLFAVIKSLPDSEEIRTKARELDEKDFDQWWWETVYKGNVL